MAEEDASLENYLSCNVCSETFRDPVSLDCKHSFCSCCLQELWKYNKHKQCPVCKKLSSQPHTGVNVALKEFADSFAGRLKPKPQKEVPMVCTSHKEEPKSFCKDEQRALCPVCDPLHPKTHKVIPIRKAVNELKDQLRTDIKCLQSKKKKYKEAKDAYNEMLQHSKKQVMSTEKRIRALFNKLQLFLKEEEETRLVALAGEGQQKKVAMAREMIPQKLASISDTIYAVEEDLLKCGAAFLINYKGTQNRIRSHCLLADPKPIPGVLIEVAKHLGNLSFVVWDKMKENVRFSQVILDPNSSSRWLYLSYDLTTVRHGHICQQLPNNPDRNSKYSFIMGSEGFNSGKHSWVVEVGDHPDWVVGVANESVDRIGEILVAPKNGFWCVQFRGGKYTDGHSVTMRVKKNLRKVRVQLDYDKGEVCFFEHEDSAHVYTHRDTFTERIFPCISVGKAIDAKTKSIKIW